jgi:hypothetical protein
LDRKPFADPVARLISVVERGEIAGILCATTITTIHYLATKAVGRQSAGKEIQKLLQLFEIAPVNLFVLQAALRAEFPDFEDGVIHEAANYIGADGIVTRDPKGFKKAEVRIYSPGELLNAVVVINPAAE